MTSSYGGAPFGTAPYGGAPTPPPDPPDDGDDGMGFPAGLTRIFVDIELTGPDGSVQSGWVQANAERMFGYTGTRWLAQQAGKKTWLSTSGVASIELPHSDQAGLTGDFGEPLTAGVAYEIVLYPLRAEPVRTLKWVMLPSALGARVNFSQLADLGGWPTHTVIVNPPPGGGGGDVEYVPVTVSGNSGYWSPVAP